MSALMHPHTITDSGFVGGFRMVFFIFGTYKSLFPKNELKCGFVWPENTFPRSFGPSQIASGLENFILRKIHECLPLCIIQFQVAFLDAPADCVERWWFSKVHPSPWGYIHHGSITVSQAIPPEGLMVTRIQQWFLPLAFTHFPWLPESFHDVMNCGWWNLNSL